MLHNWCNKGCDPVLSCLWDGAYKISLAANRCISSLSGSLPHNHKELNKSLKKMSIVPSKIKLLSYTEHGDRHDIMACYYDNKQINVCDFVNEVR